ncbi:hypothetical protein ACI3PL_22630, partial [Lacticaseibacillus paracasei]
ANADQLKEAAAKGVPPPASANPTATFPVKAAGDTDEQVSYVWTEMGKEERESMGLSQEYADKAKVYRNRDGTTRTGNMYQVVKAAREAGK